MTSRRSTLINDGPVDEGSPVTSASPEASVVVPGEMSLPPAARLLFAYKTRWTTAQDAAYHKRPAVQIMSGGTAAFLGRPRRLPAVSSLGPKNVDAVACCNQASNAADPSTASSNPDSKQSQNSLSRIAASHAGAEIASPRRAAALRSPHLSGPTLSMEEDEMALT